MASEPSAPMAGTQAPEYPVRVRIGRPAQSSRLLNFPLLIGTLIRTILCIPHLIAVSLPGMLATIVWFLATFAILFTGRFPEGMHGFVAGVFRWNTNVSAYLLGLVDVYPPFSTGQKDYPVVYDVDYPQSSSRLLNLPFLAAYIKGFLLIPHLLVLGILQIVAFVLLIVAQFVVLFSGQFPEGPWNFLAGVTRWNARINAYLLALTDRYPPFSLK